MNTLAEELNAVLDGSAAGRLLSALGRRLYFPRGIIAQSAEAKKTAKINATIGMAYEKGKPLVLSAIAGRFPDLKPEESVVYAPTAGVEALRWAWKDAMGKKNPSIALDAVSLPVVVPGITAGISYTADLFLDSGQVMLASDPSWDNYDLIFTERRGAVMKALPFFDASREGLNLDAIGAAVKKEAQTGAVRIILNFPNNPSGYTPSKAEAGALAQILLDAANGGADVLALCDDAYFGLFYEEGILKESLFGKLSTLHEKILAVKIDGPTKEDYVWGLRTAFITFGSKGLNDEGYAALEKKLMGTIRSSVSCANTPAQFLALKAMEDPRTAEEKQRYFGLLQGRYGAVKRFLAKAPASSCLQPLPFNSGYFMSFRCTGTGKPVVDAEALRQALLKKGVGTIALGKNYLRVTFAAIEEADIPETYQAIYDTAAELAAQ